MTEVRSTAPSDSKEDKPSYHPLPFWCAAVFASVFAVFVCYRVAALQPFDPSQVPWAVAFCLLAITGIGLACSVQVVYELQSFLKK